MVEKEIIETVKQFIVGAENKHQGEKLNLKADDLEV